MMHKELLSVMWMMISTAGFTQEYCIPPNGNYCNDYSIVKVQVEQISNSSACTQQGYANYTGIGPAVLTEGQSYQLNVQVQNAGTTAGVWIDYNQDNIFSSQEFTSLGLSMQQGQILFCTLNVPQGIVAGTTPMRIKAQSAVEVDPDDACELSAWGQGEIEDYSIQLLGSVASVPENHAKPFILYPNPANNFIRIDASIEYTGITIYALSGEKVLSWHFTEAGLDISSLKPGPYVVEIWANGYKYYVKLVKM